jgi:hypothetical protein
LCRLFQEFEGITLAGPEEEKKKLRVELNIKPASPIICKFYKSSHKAVYDNYSVTRFGAEDESTVIVV